MKSLLLFAGSNNPESINAKLVNYVARLTREQKAHVIQLSDYPLPLYNIETETSSGVPTNAQKVAELINAHDALVISVAEHNGSITAFLKNVLDWVSRTQKSYKIFEGKPILLLSTSPGPGGAKRALRHAEDILTTLGGQVATTFSLPGFFSSVNTNGDGISLQNIVVEKEISEALDHFLSILEKSENPAAHNFVKDENP